MRLAAKKLFRTERPRLVLLPILFVILLFAGFVTILHQPSPPLSEQSVIDAADASRVPAPLQSDLAANASVSEPSAPDSASTTVSTSEGEPVKCRHVVLFSSARHGSTWFIDSVERCKYSRSSMKADDEPFASAVFKHTEPWKHNNSALFSMSGSEVAAYVVDNSSVKVFSSTLGINSEGVDELAKEGARLGVPFVILRREPEATFRSLKVAKETGVWNGVGNSDIGNVTEMEEFDKYKNGIEGYYQRVDDILQKAGVEDVDNVDYDEIKDLKYIRLERAGCYIRNCNFAD